MTRTEPVSIFLQWLQQQHDEAMAHEQAALELLHKGDNAGYEKELENKAIILASLSDGAKDYLPSMPENLATMIAKQLKAFSGSASMGLRIGSPFYMSALLYNDDHKPGQPDNLAVFIDGLRKR